MKFAHRFVALLSLVLVLGSAGCESSGRSTRIQEKAAVFATLSPAQKQLIEHGAIDLGYTQDMAYMALGQPTRTETSTNGKDTTWVFTNYYPPDSMRTSGIMVRRVGNVRNRNVVGSNSSTSGGFNTSSQETAMELPDMVSFTLYVVFRGNKVIDLWLGDEQ